MNDLFELPSEQVRKRFEKAGAYDESKHPRDSKGRWAAAGAGLIGSAALAGALGVPGLRSLPGLHSLRRKVLGTRYAGMRERVRNTSVLRTILGKEPVAPTARVPGRYTRLKTETMRVAGVVPLSPAARRRLGTNPLRP